MQNPALDRTAKHIALEMNRGLRERDADYVIKMLCRYMRHYDLKANVENVWQIPLKPTPGSEG